MIDQVGELFAPHVLELSPLASELIDLSWIVFKIGGFVPQETLSHFKNVDENIQILSKSGVLMWSTTGVLSTKTDFKNPTIAVSISDELRELTNKAMSKKEFKEIIFRLFGKPLNKYCKSDLSKLAIFLLTGIIKYSTPDRSVLVNKIIRMVSGIGIKPFMETKEILNYYLYKFLGLVDFDGSSVNLSQKSKELIKTKPEVWNAYLKDSGREHVKIQGDPRLDHTPMEKHKMEKVLRGHFPWLKL